MRESTEQAGLWLLLPDTKNREPPTGRPCWPMPSTTIDPRREARRLIADYDRDTLELLACDPVDTVRELLSIPITFRPASRTGGSCGVDGSYDPGPPARIFVAEDT